MVADDRCDAGTANDPRGVTSAGALDKELDDLVDEASMDSFPANDPPSYWARTSESAGTTGPMSAQNPGLTGSNPRRKREGPASA
jgi:hypothetical protein